MNLDQSDSDSMDENPSGIVPTMLFSKHGHTVYETSSPDADFQLQKDRELINLLDGVDQNDLTRDFLFAIQQQLSNQDQKIKEQRLKAEERERHIIEIASRDPDSKLFEILQMRQSYYDSNYNEVKEMLDEGEPEAPPFDYPGPKYFHKHLGLYVQHHYTKIYLELGLLDNPIEDLTEVNDFLLGKTLHIPQEKQKEMLDYMKSSKTRFGLGSMLELNLDKSKKPIGNLINIIKLFEIAVFHQCFRGHTMISLPATEDVILASQLYCSFYSESKELQDFQVGEISPFINSYLTQYEIDDGVYNPFYIIFTGKLPSHLSYKPEVLWREREVKEQSRKRLQNFVPKFVRQNPDEEQPCGQYLMNYVLNNDDGAYKFQREVITSVQARIDALQEKQPLREISRKPIYVGNHEMREKDLCVTEAFAKRFFGSENQLVEDANTNKLFKDKDGTYFLKSSMSGDIVQMSFDRMKGINDEVIKWGKTRTIHQAFLKQTLKTVFSYKGVPDTLFQRQVKQTNKDSDDLSRTIIKYQSCSKGPPLFGALEMSSTLETSEVAVFQVVVKSMFVGNIYLLKESPDQIIKRDDCRHLFSTAVLKINDKRQFKFIAGKIVQEPIDYGGYKIDFRDVRGVVQHDSAVFIETHDGEIFCDDRLKTNGLKIRGTMSWGQRVQMVDLRDLPLGQLEQINFEQIDICKLLSVFEEHDLINGKFVSIASTHTDSGKLVKWDYPDNYRDLTYKYVTEDGKISNAKFRVEVRNTIGQEIYTSPTIESSDQYFGLFHNIIQTALVDFTRNNEDLDIIEAGQESANMFGTFLAPRDGYVKLRFKDEDQAKKLRHVVSNKEKLTKLGRIKEGEDMIIVEVKTSANKNVAIQNYEKKSAYKQERVTPVIGSFQGLITNVELGHVYGEDNLRLLSWLCHKMYEQRLQNMTMATSMIITKQFSLKNTLGVGRIVKK